MYACVLSWVQLFATPWTVCSPPCSSVHGIFQARILEWVAFFFSRRSFPTQGSNPGLPHCRQALCRLSHHVELSANPCPTPLLSCSPSFSLTAGIPLTHLGERRHWLFGIQAFGLRLVLRLPAQACFLGLSSEELEMMSNMAVHLRILFL